MFAVSHATVNNTNRTLHELCARTDSTKILMQDMYAVFKEAHRPASAFELSPSFFPEQYSISATKKRIRVHDWSENFCSSTTRVDEYHFLFSATPRGWQSLSLTITTMRDSVFWGLGRLPKVSPLRRSEPFFKPMERELERYLLEDASVDDLTRLSVRLCGTAPEASTPEIHSEALQVPQEASDLLNFVKDFGCAIYSEKDISFQSHSPQPRHFVCALPDGTIASEQRIRSDKVDLEELRWELSFHHCLRNSPHVSNILGVVTDGKQRYVKSILRDSEPGGVWELLRNASDKRELISLDTRLRWAWQIVAGMRDIHEKGLFIGRLNFNSLGFDGRGYLQLHGHCREGNFPPGEVHYAAPELKANSTNSKYKFTSQSDLFQLGIVLWQLVQMEVGVDFGIILGRSFDPTTSQLPDIDNPQVPDWYSKIIKDCRRDQPGDKLQASELLKMFPTSLSILPTNVFTTSTLLWNCTSLDIVCYICLNETINFFHCRTCSDGDYDICDSCIGKGKHCKDGKHFLAEMSHVKQSNTDESTGRYHSVVTPEGERKETVLYFK